MDVSDCDGAAADDDDGDGGGGALNVVDSWLDMVCGVWTGECVFVGVPATVVFPFLHDDQHSVYYFLPFSNMLLTQT